MRPVVGPLEFERAVHFSTRAGECTMHGKRSETPHFAAARRLGTPMTLDTKSYAPDLAELLESEGSNDLGSGKAQDAVRPALARLTPEGVCAPHAVQDVGMARACLAGLWLRHDFLDESHRISQDIETPAGSFWHGIMHRREGDFDNAKYWFRRVGRHPIFERLAQSAHDLAADRKAGPDAAYLIRQADWDPFAFVDLCQHAQTGKLPLEALAKSIQLREWELLFDYCYRLAIGS